MKNLFSKLTILPFLLLVSACGESPSEVAINRGAPERLIDVSSETVTFNLNSKNSLTKLSSMVAKDAPSRAELKCSIGSTKCSQAKEIFDRRSIPVKTVNESGNSIVLSYERTVVRDCNPRYADNTNAERSTYNHPALGCAVAGNMVQMVSDKKQFTNPALLDFPDAEKGVQSYSNYLKPSSSSSSDSSSQSGGASASQK